MESKCEVEMKRHVPLNPAHFHVPPPSPHTHAHTHTHTHTSVVKTGKSGRKSDGNRFFSILQPFRSSFQHVPSNNSSSIHYSAKCNNDTSIWYSVSRLKRWCTWRVFQRCLVSFFFSTCLGKNFEGTLKFATTASFHNHLVLVQSWDGV